MERGFLFVIIMEIALIRHAERFIPFFLARTDGAIFVESILSKRKRD